jgi:hypothetical protein
LTPVLVRKRSGDLCFCVDYRKLNNVMKKDCFPQLQIKDTWTLLAGAKWLFTVDLNDMLLAGGSASWWQENFAFLTNQGLWQFILLSFRLCNIPRLLSA